MQCHARGCERSARQLPVANSHSKNEGQSSGGAGVREIHQQVKIIREALRREVGCLNRLIKRGADGAHGDGASERQSSGATAGGATHIDEKQSFAGAVERSFDGRFGNEIRGPAGETAKSIASLPDGRKRTATKREDQG